MNICSINRLSVLLMLTAVGLSAIVGCPGKSKVVSNGPTTEPSDSESSDKVGSSDKVAASPDEVAVPSSPSEPKLADEGSSAAAPSEPPGRPTPSDPDRSPAGEAAPAPTAPAKDSPAGEAASAGSHDSEKQAERPLFADWPDPAAVLFITGRQDGYIEPCGCTGLANQKGGLARRFTFLEQLRNERGWAVVPLDAGNQVRRFGVQPVIKFQRTAEALQQMEYAAVAFGQDDLRLPAGELFAVVADQNQDGQTPFISANVAIFDESFTPRYRVVTAGGRKIGIISILGDEYRKQVNSDEVPVQSVDDALTKVWPTLEAEQCDVYLLLAHASLDESAEIARRFPQFDFIVTAGGVGEPTHEPETIEGLPEGATTRMIQVGTKGMYVGVLGIFGDGETTFRYQRVPLSDRYEDAPEMRQLMKDYQEQLEAVGLEGLQVKALPHPSGNKFVGSETCGACHTTAYEIWEKTPHAHATESLIHPGERSDVPRHYDPECLSCHVTGWNPQKYYPYTSGYLSLEATPRLVASGCENCHGPGSAHVAAETGNEEVSAEEQLARRQAMILPLEKAERRCMECHDLDNSPDFHQEGAFMKYWKQIEHIGKD